MLLFHCLATRTAEELRGSSVGHNVMKVDMSCPGVYVLILRSKDSLLVNLCPINTFNMFCSTSVGQLCLLILEINIQFSCSQM